MSEYRWALNAQKLARAQGTVGVEGTEEQFKAEYIRIGGKVPEVSEVTASEPVEEISEVTSSNDTTDNTEVSEPVEEIQPDNGGQDSFDDSVVGEA